MRLLQQLVLAVSSVSGLRTNGSACNVTGEIENPVFDVLCSLDWRQRSEWVGKPRTLDDEEILR